jgi:type I restriction enzyme S subunit
MIKDKVVKIGSVFRIASGGTPSRSKPEYFINGTIPWVKTGDLKGKYANEPGEYITEDALKNSSAKIFPKNTILLAMYGATIGACSILPFEAATNQACGAILPNDNCDVTYLFYYLKSIKDELIGRGVGGTQPNISGSIIKDTKIPLPPLPQQQKIANILDAADALRQKDKALLAKYDELTQALFLDMFGDPVSNPNRWKCIKGADIFKFSSGKFNPTKNLDESYTFPTYGGNGITGYSSEYLIDFDTIVIGRVGAYCGSVHKTKGKIWVTDNAIYIKDFKKDINLIFCYHTFKKYRLNRFADFSGQPKITQKPLENLQFIYPPLTLQNQFAERVQVIEQQKAIAQKSLEKSEALFNSLLQKAFKGGLVRA